MRIQMYGTSSLLTSPLSVHLILVLPLDNLSSLDALLKALSDLDDLCVTMDEAYQKSLQQGQFERWNEES